MVGKLIAFGLLIVGIIGFGTVLSLGIACGPIQRAVELAASSPTYACPFK